MIDIGKLKTLIAMTVREYDFQVPYGVVNINDGKITSFPIREYWLDIGRMDEYEKANVECKEVF